MWSMIKKIHILFGRETGIYTVTLKPPTHEKIEGSKKFNAELKKDAIQLMPRRYIIVLLGFLSFAILNAQRLNMVIALVAMTNTTTQERTIPAGQECPSANEYNSSQFSENRGTFNWTSEVEGYIIGSNFLGFVLTQFLGGRLSETLGAKQMLVFSVLCASLCNLLSPAAAIWNTYLLIGVQFLKGMAQGFTQPAVSCLMVRWYPKPDRSFLSSVTFSGFPVGALFGGILSGALCDTTFLGGWPSVFYVFGILGIILVLFLGIYAFNFPDEDPAMKDSELKYITRNVEQRNINTGSSIPWSKMASSVPFWALLAGMFGQYWMTFYFICVHPSFLSTVLHFNITQSGLLSSLPYILQMFITWLASYSSDCLARKEFATTDSVRKACNTLSCLGFSLSLLTVAYAGCNILLNTVCFFAAMGSIGLGYPGSLTVPMDMTVEFAGTLMGLASTIASTSGFIIPVVVGKLTTEQQTLDQWHKVFVISAVVVIISGIIFHLFGSAELQDWKSATDDPQEKESSSRDASKNNHLVVTSGKD